MGNLLKGRIRKQGVVVVVTGAVLVGLSLAATAAVAVFVSGGGPGAASVGTPIPLKLSLGTVPDSGAVYVGNSGDVVVEIQNDNPFPTEVFVIVQDGDITTDKKTCDPLWFTYTDQSGPWIIPALSTETLTLVGSLALSVAAGADCDGASVEVPLFADGTLVLPTAED